MSTKLKTIRINASMTTDLYLDINVPESTTEDEIYDFIKNDGIDGGCMLQHDGWGAGHWTWDHADFDCDFNPEVDDMSEHFLDKKEIES